MSDTPRTDAAVWDEHDPFAAVGHLCRTMERELAAATQERDALAARVKRLEDAGDAMAWCANQIGYASCQYVAVIRRAESAVKKWRKAKEAKP